MKLSTQEAAVFIAALLICAALVYFGKAGVELMSGPLAWLVPLGRARSNEPTTGQGGTP